MTDANIPKSRSDQSDQPDPFGILALFWSDMGLRGSDQSDLPATLCSAGPTGPTVNGYFRTGKDQQKQHGPTGPTGPTAVSQHSDGATLPDLDALDLLNRYEGSAGLTINMLRNFRAEHPDAKAYLRNPSLLGPMACDDVNGALQWHRTRA